MPDDVLANQYPLTAPIMIDDRMVEAFFLQRAEREGEIVEAMHMLSNPEFEDRDLIMNSTFPQRFDQCRPAYGSECEFRKICHGSVVDPLTEGYQKREPHHQPEMDQWKERDA